MSAETHVVTRTEAAHEIDKVWQEYEKQIQDLMIQNKTAKDSCALSDSLNAVSELWSKLYKNLALEDIPIEEKINVKESLENFNKLVKELNTNLKFAFPTFRSQLAHKLQTLCYRLYNYFFAGAVTPVVENAVLPTFSRDELHNASTYQSVFFTALAKLPINDPSDKEESTLLSHRVMASKL